ncbi:MAG: vWA domain-containing protein [Arenicellales bacterium]
MTKKDSRSPTRKKRPTLAEKTAPNGYFFDNYDITVKMQNGKVATFEFFYIIADLRRFRLVSLYDEIPNPDGSNKTKFKDRFVKDALRIARNIPNLRWFSSGMHFGGEVIVGDLRGYELEDKTLADRKNKRGSPVAKVDKRHYAGQFWDSGKLHGGRGSFNSTNPIPSNISTVMSGAGLIIRISKGLDPDRSDYMAKLKAYNKEGWGDSLAPLNPTNNRARWSLAMLDQHHIVLAAGDQGIKNGKPKPGGGTLTVHHGLTIQQFAKEIKKIGNLFSDKKIRWALHYDGSKPMGGAAAENALGDIAMRAHAYEATRTYMGLIRRVNGVIDIIAGNNVSVLDEEPPKMDIHVKKIAPRTYEFDVQFHIQARENDKPAKVTLEIDPPDNVSIKPHEWTSDKITLSPNGLWGTVAKVKFNLNKPPKSRKLDVVLRGVDDSDQELFIHRVPIYLVGRKRTAAILDQSGSMGPNDPNGNRFAALRVFSARYFTLAAIAGETKKGKTKKGKTSKPAVPALQEEVAHEAALIAFSDTASVVTGFVNNRPAYDAAIASVGGPDGGTNFNDALALTDTLFDGGDDFLTSKSIIFFTDGIHNTGEFDWSIPAKLSADGIEVNSIGLGDNTNAGLLSAIATNTGGRYFHLHSPADMATIYTVVLSDILDEDVSETLSDDIPVDSTITRPVIVRGSGVSSIQVTWDVSQPPPQIIVHDANGSVQQPVITGVGFAVFQSDDFSGGGQWQIIATASDDATNPTPIGVVVTESSGVGNRIQLMVVPIAARRYVGETLSLEASMTERGKPVPEDEGSGDEPDLGHARMWAEITTPSGANNRFQMSEETGRTGIYMRRDAMVLNKSGVYQLKIIAEGTDTSSSPYRRMFQASVVVAHPIVFADARVPKTATEGSSMTVSCRIADSSIQPDTVKLFGRNGVGGSFTGFPLAKSGDRWRGKVPDNVLAAGTFESYFLAEGDNAHGAAPVDSPDTLFQTQVKVANYAWVVEFRHHAGNRHMAARARRMRFKDVSVNLTGFTMPPALKQPANFLISRELISVDKGDGSLWCVHVAKPLVPKPLRSLVQLTAGGQLVKVPPFTNVDVATLKSFTVDGVSRHIWLGFPQRLELVDMDTRETLRKITNVNILGLAPDPASGGIWAGVRLRVGNQTINALKRFDADPIGEKDMLVTNVRPPMRAFVHPLTSGDVICFATYARVPRVVHVGINGKVKAAETSTRPRPIDMTVDPKTGRVWLVTKRVGRFVIEILGTNLKLEKTIRAWEDLKLVFVYSVDFNPETNDLWVSGAVQAGGVTGRIDAAGIFHRLVPKGETQGLVRTMY